MRRFFFLSLAIMLAGCGQKGPLYMPVEKPVAKAPTAPPPPRTQPENPMGDPPGSR
jgi:predicted small lipoprotein YifL